MHTNLPYRQVQRGEWNLEVTLQKLRAQVSDSQASTQRLESEQKRHTKLLSAGADQVENEKPKVSFDEFKAKHETDTAQARKTVAGLQREKSDLQQSLDALKLEMQRNTRRLPKFRSPLTPNGRRHLTARVRENRTPSTCPHPFTQPQNVSVWNEWIPPPPISSNDPLLSHPCKRVPCEGLCQGLLVVARPLEDVVVLHINNPGHHRLLDSPSYWRLNWV